MENYRGMAIFVQVVDSGSFSAAASKLGITKSGVSQQVSQLEEELGIRLLHRTTRQLRLTEAGTLYLEGCRQMVEAADAANQQMGLYRMEPSGTLRISCSHEFAANHLIPLLAPFMERHPKLSLDIDGTDQVINLLEEQIDLAIRIGQLDDSGMVVRKIGDLEEVLVASPAYLDQQGVPETPDDLIKHQWVAFTQKTTPYQVRLLGPAGQQKKVRLYGRTRTNSAASLREMMRSGLGIGQILKLIVKEDLEQGRLVQVLPQYRFEPVGMFAVYPQKSHLPLKVRAVIDYLVENKAALGISG